MYFVLKANHRLKKDGDFEPEDRRQNMDGGPLSHAGGFPTSFWRQTTAWRKTVILSQGWTSKYGRWSAVSCRRFSYFVLKANHRFKKDGDIKPKDRRQNIDVGPLSHAGGYPTSFWRQNSAESMTAKFWHITDVEKITADRRQTMDIQRWRNYRLIEDVEPTSKYRQRILSVGATSKFLLPP